MQSSKETLTERARSEYLVQTLLEGIAKKAKRERKYRFRDLYRQIDYAALMVTWKKLNKKINDRQFIRLIKKWLRAGILEEDGKVIHPITRT